MAEKKKQSGYKYILDLPVKEQMESAFINALKVGSPEREYFENNPEQIPNVINAGIIAGAFDKVSVKNNYLISCMVIERKREEDAKRREFQRRKEVVEKLNAKQKGYLISSFYKGYSDVRKKAFLASQFKSRLYSWSKNETIDASFREQGINLYTLRRYFIDNPEYLDNKHIVFPNKYKGNRLALKRLRSLFDVIKFEVRQINSILSRVRYGKDIPNLSKEAKEYRKTYNPILPDNTLILFEGLDETEEFHNEDQSEYKDVHVSSKKKVEEKQSQEETNNEEISNNNPSGSEIKPKEFSWVTDEDIH